MMLLIGMNTSFTKNPTNPITTNPIAVRTATIVNSGDKSKMISRSKMNLKNRNKFLKDKKEKLKMGVPLRSGL